MANLPKNSGEIYADRAIKTEPGDTPFDSSPAFLRTPPVPSPSEPAIYSGEMSHPSAQDEFARQTLVSRNKATKSNKRSPFNLMISMIVLAIAIVLYVGNVITVQQLLKEVSDEQAKLQQIRNDQEMLKAQINKMSSLERIRATAEGELGLHNPKGPPQWIAVDANKVQEIEKELSLQEPAAEKTGK